MADTTPLKRLVEPYVREVLEREYGCPFRSRRLTLSTGGSHEFDAVSDDGQVVASIKSASGRTSGGKNPSGKVQGAEAELYYLTLAPGRERLLVVTDPEFHEILVGRLVGRLAPGLSLKVIPLSLEILEQVRGVHQEASREMSRPPHS
jgi:hypothetical protein